MKKDQIDVKLSHDTKQHLIRLFAAASDFPVKARQ